MTRSSVLTHILVAVATLGLVSAAFHPLDLWPLAWVAFVPWMAYHEKTRRRGTARALMAAYYLHLAYMLQWIGAVAPPAVWAIPLLGLPFVWLCGWICDRCVYGLGMRGVVVYPLAIVSCELLRDQFLGLTWSSVGYSQWRWVEGVQSAAIFRVHLLSWAVLLVNAAIAALLLRPRDRGSLVGAVVAAAVVGTLHVGGAARLGNELEEGPLVLGVQGNIEQGAKERVPRRVTWERQRQLYAGRSPELDADLLVFAETSFIGIRPDVPLSRVLELPAWGGWLPSGRGQGTVLGHDLVTEAGDHQNVATVVVEGAPVARYAKRVLVPLGEHVPAWLPARAWFSRQVVEQGGYEPDMVPGDRFVVCELAAGPRPTRFGLNICYEMVFPGEFRGLMLEHDPDFIVNISNDGWYGESQEQDLVHVATRFRAVESGRSVFRVSNTGISTSVDPFGRYRHTVEVEGDRKAVAGLLVDRVRLDSGQTAWVRAGDLLPALLPLSLLILVGWTALRRRFSRA